jgi:hypothetical protein
MRGPIPVIIIVIIKGVYQIKNLSLKFGVM